MNEQEKPWPTVIVDRNLGGELDDISIDLDVMSDYLTKRGMSAKAIGELTINFLCTRATHEKDNRVISGTYFTKTNQIDVYMQRQLDTEFLVMDYSGGDNVNDRYLHAARTRSSERVSNYCNEVITHELEHAIIHNEGGMPEVKRYLSRRVLFGAGRKGAVLTGVTMIGANVGGAIEQFGHLDRASWLFAGMAIGAGLRLNNKWQKKYDIKTYENNPEEIRCREAESQDGLVQCTIKFPGEREYKNPYVSVMHAMIGDIQAAYQATPWQSLK